MLQRMVLCFLLKRPIMKSPWGEVSLCSVRNRKCDCRTLLDFTFDIDRSVVFFHHLFAQNQSKPGPDFIIGPDIGVNDIQPEEFFLIFPGYAHAAIRN